MLLAVAEPVTLDEGVADAVALGEGVTEPVLVDDRVPDAVELGEGVPVLVLVNELVIVELAGIVLVWEPVPDELPVLVAVATGVGERDCSVQICTLSTSKADASPLSPTFRTRNSSVCDPVDGSTCSR